MCVLGGGVAGDGSRVQHTTPNLAKGSLLASNGPKMFFLRRVKGVRLKKFLFFFFGPKGHFFEGSAPPQNQILATGLETSYLVCNCNYYISCFVDQCLHRLGGKPGAMQPCRTCQGRGIKISIRQIGPGMVQQLQSTCPDCKGEGK